MKKKIAVFFVLLANIIILAHAAIHHHHHNEICDLNSENESHIKYHKHITINCTQHPCEKNHNENCILKEVIALPNNRIISEYKNDINILKVFIFNYLQAVLPSIISFDSKTILYSNVYHCHLPNSYTYLVSKSLGLRAPPTV